MAKMKAYLAEDRWDPTFSTVVFAETRGKARAIAQHTDACEDRDFTDIRILREPVLDECYRGVPEMDWYNAGDRLALVKLCGFHCSYEIDLKPEECEKCCAHEDCARYENMMDRGRDNGWQE